MRARPSVGRARVLQTQTLTAGADLEGPFSIEDKATIVTGCGTGIGASIAHEFASREACLQGAI